MRLCKHCKHPLDRSSRQEFCNQTCSREHREGIYCPHPIPLSKRYPDPIWGGLDLWRDRS